MQRITQPATAGVDEVGEAIDKLTAMEPSDAAFLSCYLDASAGRAACLRFLVEKAAAIRAKLDGNARLEFENALTMVERQLELVWHPEVKGLALFARSPAGGRQLSVLRLAVPVANRLALYRLPEILPLVELVEKESPFMLLLARQGGLQVLDADIGRVAPRAWAADVRRLQTTAGARSGSGSVATLDRGLQTMRRIVSASSSPLVLAGDSDAMAKVREWLPRRAAARLADCVEVPCHLEQHEAIDRIRSDLAEVRRVESRRLATRLVRAMRGGSLAVAGECATLEALHAGLAHTLVLSADCDRSDNVQWDAPIELSRLAWRQGARVVLADSDELRYLGGVGCLLRQPAEAAAMRTPPRAQRLDLVA